MPPPFRLTERDFAILYAVARFRFLSSTLIIHLAGGSTQQILRRLQLLFHHGYLDRPPAQVAQLAHAFDFGNQPFIYGLGSMGAQVLAKAGMPVIERLDWRTKNVRATVPFFAHTIATAETMIAFDLARREIDTARLIDHYDLIPYLPEATRDDDAPLSARVQVPLKRRDERSKEPKEGRIKKRTPKSLTIGIFPDRLFSLFLANSTQLNFALEQDQGTMDIRSKRLVGKSSFRRKLMGYYHLWKQGLHTDRWGFKSFRLLTVTPSEKRIENMIAVQREIVGDQGSNLFLFSTPKRLQEKSPLADVWVSGKGETVSLLPA
jgi:Replication-relaxation